MPPGNLNLMKSVVHSFPILTLLFLFGATCIFFRCMSMEFPYLFSSMKKYAVNYRDQTARSNPTNVTYKKK